MFTWKTVVSRLSPVTSAIYKRALSVQYKPMVLNTSGVMLLIKTTAGNALDPPHPPPKNKRR